MQNDIDITEYTVVKSNELIQKSRYALSSVSQKVIAFLCAMIRTENQVFIKEYEFNIRDYAKICDIDCDNGTLYNEIKSILKGLRDFSIWITFADGSERTVSWLSKASINRKSGIVSVIFDDDIIPYISNLKERFTIIELYNMVAMKSRFSMRFYELLKSYQHQKSKTFNLDELKKMLMVSDVKSYSNFKDFRRKVLEVAQKEINEITDIDISFEAIYKGKKVIKVKFTIKNKLPLDRYANYLKATGKTDENYLKVIERISLNL